MADKNPGPGHAMFGLNDPVQSAAPATPASAPSAPQVVYVQAPPPAPAPSSRRRRDALAGRRAAGPFGG